MKNIKAQSTLEYVLVLTAIVAIIIAAAGKIVGPQTKATLENANTVMTNAAAKIK